MRCLLHARLPKCETFRIFLRTGPPRTLVMRMQGFQHVALAFCALAFANSSAFAQIDGAFIQQAPPARTAPARSEIPDYDSDYEAASRLQGSGGNTPEADARPGEYYFILAANAF